MAQVWCTAKCPHVPCQGWNSLIPDGPQAREAAPTVSNLRGTPPTPFVVLLKECGKRHSKVKEGAAQWAACFETQSPVMWGCSTVPANSQWFQLEHTLSWKHRKISSSFLLKGITLKWWRFSSAQGQVSCVVLVGVKNRIIQVSLRQWCHIRLLKAGRAVSSRHTN